MTRWTIFGGWELANELIVASLDQGELRLSSKPPLIPALTLLVISADFHLINAATIDEERWGTAEHGVRGQHGVRGVIWHAQLG